MLKPQDCVLLLKFLAHVDEMKTEDWTGWSQRQLSSQLCISLSEVNACIKRLLEARLLRIENFPRGLFGNLELPVPVVAAAEEYLIYGIKYSFAVQLGEMTRGIVTSFAAPVFEGQIDFGSEPVPVWPYAKGNIRGLALEPLYVSVPQAISEYPDQSFYDLLALVDAIRQGRARERNLAIKILKKRLSHEK